MRRKHSKAVQGSGTLDVLRYGRLLQGRRARSGVRGAGFAFDGRALSSKASPATSRAHSFKQEFALTRSGLLPTVGARDGMTASDQFYGKYRGTVVNNIDPMMIGRIQAIVPDVSNIVLTSWAMPCFPVAGIQTGMSRACR